MLKKITIVLVCTILIIFLSSVLEPKTQSPTPLEVVGWSTYTNIKHGYSFQHPPDWVITQSVDQSIIFSKANYSKLDISGNKRFSHFATLSINKSYVPYRIIPCRGMLSPKVCTLHFLTYFLRHNSFGLEMGTGWENINNIFVWSHASEKLQGHQYDIFTNKNKYSLTAMFFSGAENDLFFKQDGQTSLEPEDYEILEKVISTFSISDPSEKFINFLPNNQTPLTMLDLNQEELVLGGTTTITWLPGNAKPGKNTVSIFLWSADSEGGKACLGYRRFIPGNTNTCGPYQTLFRNIPNTGSVKWNIPKSYYDDQAVPPGNYYMSISFDGYSPGETPYDLLLKGFNVESYSKTYITIPYKN